MSICSESLSYIYVYIRIRDLHVVYNFLLVLCYTVLLYIQLCWYACMCTGHGGEDFLQFQDAQEISNAELADAFGQMWQKRR